MIKPAARMVSRSSSDRGIKASSSTSMDSRFLMLFILLLISVTHFFFKQNWCVVSITRLCVCRYSIPGTEQCKSFGPIQSFVRQPAHVDFRLVALRPTDHFCSSLHFGCRSIMGWNTRLTALCRHFESRSGISSGHFWKSVVRFARSN